MGQDDAQTRQADIDKVYACLRRWLVYAIGLHSSVLEERREETLEALEAMRRIVQVRFEWSPRGER